MSQLLLDILLEYHDKCKDNPKAQRIAAEAIKDYGRMRDHIMTSVETEKKLKKVRALMWEAVTTNRNLKLKRWLRETEDEAESLRCESIVS
jgi:cell fate (sporulation/competence/biofilm development) regulator YmcA (YheA/YmcA/DUF963 family)